MSERLDGVYGHDYVPHPMKSANYSQEVKAASSACLVDCITAQEAGFEFLRVHQFRTDELPLNTELIYYFNTSDRPITVKDRNGNERIISTMSEADVSASDFSKAIERTGHLHVIKLIKLDLSVYRHTKINSMDQRFDYRDNLKRAYHIQNSQHKGQTSISNECAARLNAMYRMIEDYSVPDHRLDTIVIHLAIPISRMSMKKSSYIEALDANIRIESFDYEEYDNVLDFNETENIHPFSREGSTYYAQGIIKSIYRHTAGMSIRIRSQESLNHENSVYWQVGDELIKVPVCHPSSGEGDGIYITKQDSETGIVEHITLPLCPDEAQKYGIYYHRYHAEKTVKKVAAEQKMDETAELARKLAEEKLKQAEIESKRKDEEYHKQIEARDRREEERKRAQEEKDRLLRETHKHEKYKFAATVVGAIATIGSTLFGIFKLLATALGTGNNTNNLLPNFR